jgi:hypothetical protein
LERALTRQEVLLGTVLEAVGARGWADGLLKSGEVCLDYGSKGLGWVVEGWIGYGGVAKNAMERAFGDMVVLGGGRDRETDWDRILDRPTGL